MHHRERGFASFFAALLVFSAIALIMLAVGAQSAMKVRRSTEEDSAAQLLNRVAGAELVSAQLYGETLPPSALIGSLANPISCTNPMLIDGEDGQLAAEGYSLLWAGDNSIASVGTCPIGSKTFTLTATPNGFAAKRYFFLDQTGVIRFDDGSPATASSPVYTIASPHQTVSTVLTMNGGTTTPGTNPPPVMSATGSTALNDFGTPPGQIRDTSPFSGSSNQLTLNTPNGIFGPSASFSQLGVSESPTNWSVSMTGSFNAESYTIGLCNETYDNCTQPPSSWPGAQNGAWNQLACTITAPANTSCSQAIANLTIAPTDPLQVVIWVGNSSASLQHTVSWTLTFAP